MNSVLFVLLFTILFSFIIYTLLINVNRKKRVKQRRHLYIHAEEKTEVKKRKENRDSPLIRGAGKALSFLPVKVKTEDKLQQAGFTLSGSEFLAVRILAASAAGVVSWLLFNSIIHLFIGLAAGFAIPAAVVSRKRKKRLELLTHQLIETLGTMANSLRAGFSFLQAMQLVSKEMPDPLGPEFGRVVKEISLGRPVDEALVRMTERLPNKELEVIVQGIVAQRENGGNLAGLLISMEETIRGRIKVQDELKTLVAQGKMSSWIITMLPVALALFMYFVNYDYISIMLTEPLGWMISFMGTVSIFIGWLLIQKVIKIEV
ncbi:type II secretion system F family protein [Alkalicoccus halolimnae]|uniref:Type II secretion system F family protein n=1 Tax=Alkalicoccus halolimnae TaxID=1667239 RepID=A0A5C7FFM3_9BACI|nr:type II secretion system F family protein [Alkalicoccus halolimnae]TXF86097.1 type II secretion system F family protein [Alkalicoccus halolimnae]